MRDPNPVLPEGWRWYPGLRQAHASVPGHGRAVVVMVAEWGVEVEADLDGLVDPRLRPESRRLEREASERVVPEISAWLEGRWAAAGREIAIRQPV